MPRRKSQTARSKRPARSELDKDYAKVKSFLGRLAPPMALAAYRGASSLVNVEVKHADVSFTSAVSSTPAVSYLSGIAQGDSNLTRDGNSVKLLGGRFTQVLTIDPSASTSYIRTMIVADTRGAGAAPSAADIFDSATVVGLPNLDTAPNRFMILYDTFDTLSINGSRSVVHDFDLAKVANLHLMFNGTAATVGSSSGLTLWLISMSNEATNTVGRRSECRLFFVDN